MGFHEVVLLPFRASFPPHFQKIVTEVKAFETPYVQQLWLGVSKEMLSIKYLCSIKAFLASVIFHGDHEIVTKLR